VNSAFTRSCRDALKRFTMSAWSLSVFFSRKVSTLYTTSPA